MTSNKVSSGRIYGRTGLSIFLAAVFSLCTSSQIVIGGEKKKQAPATVGKCIANKGVLLVGEDKKWRAIRPGDALPANKSLMALFDSTVLSANQAVSVRMIGGVGQYGSFSVFSTALRFHPATKTDLDISVERGIVVFTNVKKSGSAKIRLHKQDKKYLDLTLQEPGTQVGLEVFSRHGPGAAALEKDEPITFVYFLTLKGHAVLANTEKSFRLQAPPGPAVLKWDSLFQQPEVEYLKTLPDGAQPDEKAKKAFAAINECASRLANKFNKELKSLGDSKDPVCRRVAVTAMGATNRLPLLFGVLSLSKNDDVRKQTIVVLREWLGRKPGQIKKMQTALVEKVNVPPAAAKTFIHLLIGFDKEEQSQPILYEMLIDMLKHQRLAVRELAHWHLVRLVPTGKEIPYDADGSAEQQQTAIKRWRQLVPPGQLPPDPEATAKPKGK